MRKGIAYFVMAFLFCGSMMAQETKKWTLQECIDYALDKNIKLKQDRLSLQESEVNVKQAKGALFPSLSFATNQSVVNRPYQENSNIVSGSEVISSDSKTTYNSNYGLTANWTVWNANKRKNNIKQQKVNSKISSLAVDETSNSLKEQIVQTFIQILYANESIKINEGTLAVSKAQYERGLELLKAGTLSKADVAQLSVQVSADEYQLVTAQSTLQTYKLQLKQILEIDDDSQIDLAIPELNNQNILAPLPSKADIYNEALASRPEIESGKLNVESADLGISIAKSGYYPTVNLNASSSSIYANSNDGAWAEQMKKAWNNTVGLNVSVPIFNNRETKSAVEKARIKRQSSELSLTNDRKDLYKAVETLWLDATNAQQQFAAADSKYSSAKTSFDMVNEQFNLGMKNIVELLTEKNNLLSAQQQRVQAKYMSLLNRAILGFYGGENPVNILEANN